MSKDFLQSIAIRFEYVKMLAQLLSNHGGKLAISICKVKDYRALFPLHECSIGLINIVIHEVFNQLHPLNMSLVNIDQLLPLVFILELGIEPVEKTIFSC